MERIGAIAISFEEAETLADLIPWKGLDAAGICGVTPETSATKDLGLSGLVYLSTCNRVEFIYSLKEDANHVETTHALIRALPELPRNVTPRFYTGREVVRHLIRLSLGLESMVLGETEIRAQLKDAFADANQIDSMDIRLRTLIQEVFEAARVLHGELPAERLPLSAASLSVKKLREALIKDQIARLSPEEVARQEAAVRARPQGALVIIGSGPMSRQGAEYLSKWSDKVVMVNRTIEKVRETAERLDAKLMDFDEFMSAPESLGPVTAVISATSRDDAFITQEFAARLKSTSNEPLYLVDLALPADVEPECADIEDVRVISLDTLRVELEDNKQKRQDAIHRAEGPIEDAMVRIEAELITSLSAPLIRGIQKDVRERSRHHLDILLSSRLSHLSEKDKRLLYTWAISAHKDMNRIHSRGVESVIRDYYSNNSPDRETSGNY